jgi:hypothetical protein
VLLASLVVSVLLGIALGGLGLGELAAVSIVGLLVIDASLVLALIVSGGFLGGVVSGFAVGRGVLRGRLDAGRYDPVVWAVLGTLLFVLLAAVPYVGWLVRLLAALVGIGVVALGLWSARPTAPAPTV